MITDAVVLAEDDAITLEVPAADRRGPLPAPRRRDLRRGRRCSPTSAASGARWACTAPGPPRSWPARCERSVPSGDPARPRRRSTGWPEFANAAVPAAGRLFRRDVYGVPGYVLRVPRGRRRRVDVAAAAGRRDVGPACRSRSSRGSRPAGPSSWWTWTPTRSRSKPASRAARSRSPRAATSARRSSCGSCTAAAAGWRAAWSGCALDGHCVPAARAAIRHEAREIGHVTSAAWSPRLGRSRGARLRPPRVRRAGYDASR